MTAFERLRAARQEVVGLAPAHRRSIAMFRAEGKAWFKLFPDEELEDKTIRHKSTTASCLESLADTYQDDHRARYLIDEVAPQFAQNALAQEDERWESEDAAWVYCRVRTLPAIIRFAPDVADENAKRVRELVSYVWEKVRPEPRHEAVYERPSLKGDEEEKQTPSYPPNAFHTFWALRVLHMCAARKALAGAAKPHKEARQIAILWTQNMLASQIALHTIGSERADPNQLAWSLIAQFVDPHRPIEPSASEFARRDLYQAALAAFFEQQGDNGAWPLGQPLFHYPTAGNAYCYTFETLTELLRPALYESSGTLLRELLLPHLDGLMRAFRYAQRSARPLIDEGLAYGWSSGHHPHRTKPEGWATAAVFSYVECLRRLLGKWTHDAAALDLRARTPLPASPSEALKELEKFGNTWRDRQGWSVSEQLATLFLHPAASRPTRREHPMDPDVSFIRQDQARSAILFGPPGTGKTTLVEALAAALGWGFVSIHASEFLNRGMDHVPARADEVFDRLMELDHCVVFFDEIDELLRERQAAETDPFGRFLTTTMLPKVAKLWSQRRVFFFVATNDIAHADRAIKRSQRFDAAIFVPPPSLAVKLELLSDELGGARRSPRIRLADVEEALSKSADQNPLGYLALLRYDQIKELAARLRETGRTRKDLEQALRGIGAALGASDWSPGTGQPTDAFKAFARQREEERLDYRVTRSVWVEGKVSRPPSAELAIDSDPSDGSEDSGGTYLRLPASPTRPPEIIRLGRGTAQADGLFRYFRPAA